MSSNQVDFESTNKTVCSYEKGVRYHGDASNPSLNTLSLYKLGSIKPRAGLRYQAQVQTSMFSSLWFRKSMFHMDILFGF